MVVTTFSEAVALLFGLGMLVGLASYALFKLSAWSLFGAGCVPAALVLGLGLARGPCGSIGTAEVVIVLALVLSLAFYAAAAVPSVVDGFRSGRSGDEGNRSPASCSALL